MKEESIPMKKVDVAKVFGIDTKMEVFGFEAPTERVPEIEQSYVCLLYTSPSPRDS